MKKSSRTRFAVEEIKRLSQMLADGNLSARANLDIATGDARDILIAVNMLLDSATRPAIAFGDGIGRMASEHEKGDIDVVMPADRFKGDFAVMAQDINGMVAGHIAVKKKAMACVKAFGEGDFNAPLEQFAGKKAFINDTIETLRGNLRSIITEIQTLTTASTAGRLSERGNADRYVGDFAKVVLGINGMLDAIILPIMEGNRVLDLVSAGDLTQRIDIACEGDHQRMKDAVNALVDSLTTFAVGVADAANRVAAGSMELSASAEQLSQGSTEQA
ncbi:chemotaxis protein, partial [Methylobacterium tarhaniae]